MLSLALVVAFVAHIGGLAFFFARFASGACVVVSSPGATGDGERVRFDIVYFCVRAEMALR